MKNMLIGEVVIIILLIFIILVVPSGNSVSELEDSSLKTEHVGRINFSQGGNTPVTGNQNSNSDNTPDDGIEKTLVSISRPKGGFAAYENGTFVEPEPETEVELPDDGDGMTGDSTSDGDGTDDGTGNVSDGDGAEEDGESGEDNNTGDDSEDNSDDDNSGDFDWDMKDPTKAIDSGKRATTTAPIKIRSTPTIQTEDNVMDTLSEGEVLIVTDAEVSSPDPDVPNWVEVYYEGQIGYISAKYVSVE